MSDLGCQRCGNPEYFATNTRQCVECDWLYESDASFGEHTKQKPDRRLAIKPARHNGEQKMDETVCKPDCKIPVAHHDGECYTGPTTLTTAMKEVTVTRHGVRYEFADDVHEHHTHTAIAGLEWAKEQIEGALVTLRALPPNSHE